MAVRLFGWRVRPQIGPQILHNVIFPLSSIKNIITVIKYIYTFVCKLLEIEHNSILIHH